MSCLPEGSKRESRMNLPKGAVSSDTALFYFVSFHYNTSMKYGIYAIVADMNKLGDILLGYQIIQETKKHL